MSGNFDKFKKEPDRKEKRAKKFSKKPNLKAAKSKRIRKQKEAWEQIAEEKMRLNRFIALAGVCSRREADVLIKEGKVKVNGKVCKDLSTKVLPGEDTVEYNGKTLRTNRFVYFLMNKPKDHISTTSDDRGRKTVMDIIERYTKDRVYPVGRLDRNTTGLLLFTNDGELAKKLTHPSHRVEKIYHVGCDRQVEPEDLTKLAEGIELEDGLIHADKIAYVEGSNDFEIGIEIHSGRNRIVRRMFEHLGYKVVKLDRVKLGPLTKKLLPRGKVRPLSSKEVSWLKMIK